MKSKIKAVAASSLTMIAFVAFSYSEVGVQGLKEASIYVIASCIPLMPLIFRYKERLNKIPKFVIQLGMILGIVMFNTLYKYKIAFISAALVVGSLFMFVAIIYNDNELRQE